MPEPLFLAPGWLAAVTADGVTLVGPEDEVVVGFEALLEDRHRFVTSLEGGLDPPRLAELTQVDPEEAEALLTQLRERGSLCLEPPDPPAEGVPLAQAILGLERDGELPPLCFTAEEALLVPTDPGSGWSARNAVRRFVAGLSPATRLSAYAAVARDLRSSVSGDLPPAGRLEQVLADQREEIGGEAVHILDLREGERTSVPLREVDRLGAHVPHRLGPVLSTAERAADNGGRSLVFARYAAPTLRDPGQEERWGRGSGRTRAHAELVARAEAVERWAAGDASRLPLIRATQCELEGAVDPELLLRLNRRQYEAGSSLAPHEPDVPLLWTPAWACGGERRWVPAEAVLYPFADPELERPVSVATSSGMAAHTDFAEACTRALCELVERDAFMWTWIQRVSRERVQHRSLPPGCAHWWPSWRPRTAGSS